MCSNSPSFQLHIDAGQDNQEEVKEETDFFESLSSKVEAPPVQLPHKSPVVEEKRPEESGAPDVSIALSGPVAAPVQAPAKKSTIGGKKPAAKKTGLGARKGKRGCSLRVGRTLFISDFLRFGSSEGHQELR